MMEKTKAYSTSLGTSDLSNTFGRWTRQGKEFVENAVDFWHKGTQYFVTGNPVPLDILEKKLFETLLYCNDDKAVFSLQIIKRQLVYIPVAEAHGVDVIIFDDPDGHFPWLKGLNKDQDCLKHLSKRILTPQTLQEIGSAAFPVTKHYSEFIEYVQHYANVDQKYNAIDIENVTVTFIPVLILEFSVKGQHHVWAVINDDSSEMIHAPHSLKENPQYRLGSEFEEDAYTAGGCLTFILILMGAIALGYNVWLNYYHKGIFGFLLRLVGVEILYLIVAAILFKILISILTSLYGLLRKFIITKKLKKRTEYIQAKLKA